MDITLKKTDLRLNESILSILVGVSNETKDVSEYSSMKEALDKIRKLSMPDDRIVITGSFYTVGAAIQYLN